ncbi:uncharacterized protein CG3556 [Caerostris darwini]|uniref:Uncharacterized protein CG3556 n=1 Tax=Caerostris darwini TaxID=1538125 RepID=A0AAV4UND7_9ARAC|nr:uncharacterized protein CG3556 [Caerostris darwini]
MSNNKIFITSIWSVLLLFTVSYDPFFQTPTFRRLPEANEFYCENKIDIIYKFKWCDFQTRNCPDNSDEVYCNYANECPWDYFTCDTGACIPESGRCDGYPSCPDGSDEFDCGCEDITAPIGEIIHSVHVGRKRSSKCWRIIVPADKYLNLQIISSKFAKPDGAWSGEEHEFDSSQDCSSANFTVTKGSLSSDITLCPGDESRSKSVIKTFSDTEIRHSRRSISSSHSRQSSTEMFDAFTISYSIVELLCLKPESIKCSEISCVSSEKKCDGVRDCFNGIDEVRCEKGVFTVPGVNNSRILGLNWLKKQRNAAWGWRDNTHRAIVALYLAQGANFNGTKLDEDLTAKQLELQMSTAILRNETDQITPTQLAMYINALLVICHDPRNFYGFNLVSDLQHQVEFAANTTHPLPYLALCNAKENISEDAVEKLVKVLESTSDHSFLVDVQSTALMALSCVGNSSKASQFNDNITKAVERLKQHQNGDGSFGNIYTTALVIQALISSGDEEAKDWNLKAAIEFLKQKQNKDGSFGDFLATYLILPILNAKSLKDIGKVNCTENLKMPRDDNPVSDIETKLGPKMSVKYYLYIGEQKDQIHPLFLRIPANITVLDMMRLASEADPKYKFQAQSIKGKLYIYEIFGIANDPEDEKFWLLHIGSGNSSIHLTTRSPDEVYLKNNDKVVMWYKSAKIN